MHIFFLKKFKFIYNFSQTYDVNIFHFLYVESRYVHIQNLKLMFSTYIAPGFCCQQEVAQMSVLSLPRFPFSPLSIPLFALSLSSCTSTLNPVWTRITQQPTCLTWSYNTPREVIGPLSPRGDYAERGCFWVRFRFDRNGRGWLRTFIPDRRWLPDHCVFYFSFLSKFRNLSSIHSIYWKSFQ